MALAKIFNSGQIKTYIQGRGCFLEMKLAKKGQKAEKDISDVKNADRIRV